MADPVSASIMAVATVVTTVGAIRAGQATQAAANYNSDLARQNAQVTMDQLPSALVAQQREASGKIGAARAQYGASGVSGDSGSPLDVLQSSAANAAMDAEMLKYNYHLKALGYNNSANLYSFEGQNARNNSYITAAGTLLAGGSKVAGLSMGKSEVPAPDTGVSMSATGGSDIYGVGGLL